MENAVLLIGEVFSSHASNPDMILMMKVSWLVPVTYFSP
jgi:hypothetical protein